MNVATGTSVTISHIFGEFAWLLTQSARHNALPISELTWQTMPAIARRQFHLFRDGDRPVGVATWALLNETSERLLIEGLFHPPHAGEEAWSSGDRLWVIDIVAPFSTDENKQVDVMFGDLVAGPLKGKAFKMVYVDPASGERKPVKFDADTGARMVDALSASNRR